MVGGTKISLPFFQVLFHRCSDLPAIICIPCYVLTDTTNGKAAAVSLYPPVCVSTSAEGSGWA